MEKKLKNLRWRPMWVTHLGCVNGCIDYLDLDVSDAWLFGATGHAFIINIHEVVCPSGPTAWNTEMLFKLGENIGYSTGGIFGTKTDSDFAEKKKEAWNSTKSALDAGLPCYGWELDIPEYYVIYGYDDDGYHFSGPGPGDHDYRDHKPWNELGETEIGVLEIYGVDKGQPADDSKTIKDALSFVLEHSKSPEKWIVPKYKAGLAGYDSWIDALETGKADGFGMAYNSVVWCECRAFAVQFLKEAGERLDGKFSSMFDDAMGHYEMVSENLKKVSEAFPFPPESEEIKDPNLCKNGVEHLRSARKAEESGLKALESIKNALP